MIYGGCNCGNCHLTILPTGDVYALLPAHHVFETDTALLWEQMAAVSETWFTAWGSLFECLQLKAEDTLLVRGATCALGYAVIQIAKALVSVIILVISRQDRRIRAPPEIPSHGHQDCIN